MHARIASVATSLLDRMKARRDRGSDRTLRLADPHDDHRQDSWRASPRPPSFSPLVQRDCQHQHVVVVHVASDPPLYSFLRFIRALIEERRRDPQDDLLSALVASEESGDRLNADELAAMVFLLLIAGHETTVNLVGNGVLTLLEHPAEMAQLRDALAGIETAVEELLRFAGPLDMATERFAREDLVIGGTTIPRDALVYAVLASANRDERQFQQPKILDLNRQLNRHVAFGQGIHFCLGAPLARLEGQIAIQTLLERTHDLRLIVPPDRLRWRSGLVLRGVVNLPVTFTRDELNGKRICTAAPPVCFHRLRRPRVLSALTP